MPLSRSRLFALPEWEFLRVKMNVLINDFKEDGLSAATFAEKELNRGRVEGIRQLLAIVDEMPSDDDVSDAVEEAVAASPDEGVI